MSTTLVKPAEVERKWYPTKFNIGILCSCKSSCHNIYTHKCLL